MDHLTLAGGRFPERLETVVLGTLLVSGEPGKNVDLETTSAYRHRLGFTNSVKPSTAAWLQKIFDRFLDRLSVVPGRKGLPWKS